MNQLTKLLINYNDNHVVGRGQEAAERDMQDIIELSIRPSPAFEPASELGHSTIEDAVESVPELFEGTNEALNSLSISNKTHNLEAI